MKSLVRFSKGLHVDNQTLSAMFLGYVVLLFVAGNFIVKDVKGTPAKEETVIITSKEGSVTVNQPKYPTSLYTQ
jgi:hypothetical protein